MTTYYKYRCLCADDMDELSTYLNYAEEQSIGVSTSIVAFIPHNFKGERYLYAIVSGRFEDSDAETENTK